MASNVKVRGCCCGIPFGFGILTVVASSVALWNYGLPDWLPF